MTLGAADGAHCRAMDALPARPPKSSAPSPTGFVAARNDLRPPARRRGPHRRRGRGQSPAQAHRRRLGPEPTPRTGRRGRRPRCSTPAPNSGRHSRLRSRLVQRWRRSPANGAVSSARGRRAARRVRVGVLADAGRSAAIRWARSPARSRPHPSRPSRGRELAVPARCNACRTPNPGGSARCSGSRGPRRQERKPRPSPPRGKGGEGPGEVVRPRPPRAAGRRRALAARS